MPRRFNFLGSEACHETKMGFQVDFEEAPCLHRIQELFEDLFLQWRVNPEYLFVSKHDIEALTNAICMGTNVRFAGPVMAGSDAYLIDGPAVHSYSTYARTVTMICNQVTGQLVHLVPLPGLEPHHVIIGFFK